MEAIVVAGVLAVLAGLGALAMRLRRRRIEELPVAAPGVAGDPDSPLNLLLQGSLDLLGGVLTKFLGGAAGGPVTLLFCDVEGSTRLNLRLGDERWADVLTDLHSVARAVVRGNRGRIVKTQGDGFMAVFRSAEDGVRAAIGLREGLVNNPDIGTVLPVRIGLHTGRAVGRAGDYFGTEVVTAARIADHARGQEILVSQSVHDQAADLADVTMAQAGKVRLKGLPGRHQLYRL